MKKFLRRGSLPLSAARDGKSSIKEPLMLKITFFSLIFLAHFSLTWAETIEQATTRCHMNLQRFKADVSKFSGVNLAWLDSHALRCEISKEECSAMYANKKIYMGIGGENCHRPYNNLSVLYHEGTHWLGRLFARTVIDNILDEALADMVQSVLLNTSIFAENFNSKRMITYLRDSDTFLQYPKDFYGDAHAGSLIFSSAVWRFYELTKANYSLEISQKMLMRTIVHYIKNYDLSNGFETFGRDFLNAFAALYPDSHLRWGLREYLQEAGLLRAQKLFEIENFFSPKTSFEGSWYLNERPLLLRPQEEQLCLSLDKEKHLSFRNSQGTIIYLSRFPQATEKLIKEYAISITKVPVGVSLDNNDSVAIDLPVKDERAELLRYVVVNSPFLHPADLEIGFDDGSSLMPLQKGMGQIPLEGMLVPYKKGKLVINQYGRGIESDIESLTVYDFSSKHCSVKEVAHAQRND